ncbi:D-alanine--D-alanine ligase [candidate division KSB1 bacterium]|nr:D-alanine--D-alanine ligase [candidate division KSB1 bacterium]RQW05682.1 MAG: D-alanine--D-alanine ligase [candidate division KSB1 bacterium]
MAKKIRLGLLFGGRSAEHQVSLVSATSVMNALNRDKYEVIPIGITPQGQWLTGDQSLRFLKEGRTAKDLLSFLPADPTQKALLLQNHPHAAPQKLDVVFPVLHGTYGEDGTIQGLFELADIPYVGASVLGSAVAMDKILQKQITNQAGIPSVDYLWIKGVDWHNPTESEQPAITHQLARKSREEVLQAIRERLGFPVFVKPPNLGSSVGISKARDEVELREGIETALQFDRKVLIEKAVPHAREIEVAVLGNEHPKAAIPGEVIPSNEFYDYDAKYVDNASALKIPAELESELLDFIRSVAIQSVTAVEVEGMARVDFLVNDETKDVYLNEINTIPGFTSISMYPKMWEASGLSYPELLDELIRLAIDRHEKKRRLKTVYQPKEDWYR